VPIRSRQAKGLLLHKLLINVLFFSPSKIFVNNFFFDADRPQPEFSQSLGVNLARLIIYGSSP
jgi:hypothetical protein